MVRKAEIRKEIEALTEELEAIEIEERTRAKKAKERERDRRMNVGGNFYGARSAKVEGLQPLKTAAEGGTKKDHEDWEEKILNVVQFWQPHGEDVSHVICEREKPEIEPPENLTEEQEKNKAMVAHWNGLLDNFTQRTLALDANCKAVFSLIMSNVTRVMKGQIKQQRGFEKAQKGGDLIWLVSIIDDIINDFVEAAKPTILSIIDQIEEIYKLRQMDLTNDEYVEKFQKKVKLLSRYGAHHAWGQHMEEQLAEALNEAMEKIKEETGLEATDDELKESKKMLKAAAKEQIVAMAIIKQADKKRFGDLQTELKNSYVKKRNEYPTTVADALTLLNNYTSSYQSGGRNGGNRNGGNRNGNNNQGGNGRQSLSFLQSGQNGVPVYLRGTNNLFRSQITCHGCGFKGHYKSHCPVVNENGDQVPRESEGEASVTQEVSSIQRAGILLNQYNDSHINPSWILLDSCSTDHIFCNEEFLTDIEPTTDGEMLRLHTSGGSLDSTQKGKFGGITVWYNPKSLANILSLALVTERYRVTMDSEVGNALKIHISNEHVLSFYMRSPGLYVCDASQLNLHKLSNAFSFLKTVSQNKALFNSRDIRKADEAVTLHRRTNHMAEDKFLRVVGQNWIHNNPVTVGDVKRRKLIYGPSLPAVKGRTRYQKSNRVPDVEVIQLPKELYENLRDVTPCVDFYFVNGITIYHSIS